MDSDRFEALVNSLEDKQCANPKGFLIRTGLLAGLGFGYLLVVLLIALALTVGIVVFVLTFPNGLTIKLGLVVGVLTGGLSFAVMRGLWVKMDAPEGLLLSRKNAPALVELIKELRQRIGSISFDRVLLTSDYNASVVQVPRLGVFGWHRNYLMLGLPLMQSMKPKEFEAVLAHEFAHLSGGHGRFGNWLYRLRRSWQQLFAHLAQQQTGGVKVLTVFLDWFWPRFNAHAFVLSRAQEYEADALAARIVGANDIATALTRISVYERHLDEAFWKRIYDRATREPEPPTNIFAELPATLKSGPEGGNAEKWMRQAFLVNTTTSDTHPCLRERLAALQCLPQAGAVDQFPSLDGPTAADVYLGREQEPLTAQLSHEWAGRVCEHWKLRHAETKDLAAILQDAPPDESNEQPSIEVLWKKAEALARLEGTAAAQPVVAEILALDPAHPGALFARGAYRLQQDDANGIADLEQVLRLDSKWEEAVLESLGGYYHRQGDKEMLRDIQRRWDKHGDVMQAAHLERVNVSHRDTFLPQQLTDVQKEVLSKLLAAEPMVAVAWCARKQTQHLTDQPLHVIALQIKVAWWKFRSAEASQKLINRLCEGLPEGGTFYLFTYEANLKALGKKIEKSEHSLIYKRETT